MIRVVTALDVVATVTLFVAGLVPVAFCLSPWGWYMTLTAVGEYERKRSKLASVLYVAAFVVPPLALIGIYVTTMVLAALASGWTFWYPLVGLAFGGLAWYGGICGIGWWIEELDLRAHFRERRSG